jgi:hypothetical protein
MSKAGNAHLRAAAYRMAVVGITHNPVISAHYERKRAAGKSKMNALGHCMSKALNLVWGVWRNGADFDPDWSHALDKALWDLVPSPTPRFKRQSTREGDWRSSCLGSDAMRWRSGWARSAVLGLDRDLIGQASTRVKVRGSSSAWSVEEWDDVRMGAPDPQPLYPSPGTVNGPVGIDAAFVFAYGPSWEAAFGSSPTPIKWNKLQFSVDGGDTFTAPESKMFNSDKRHRYTYKITGAGQLLRVMFADLAADNYGRYRVEVKAAP